MAHYFFHLLERSKFTTTQADTRVHCDKRQRTMSENEEFHTAKRVLEITSSPDLNLLLLWNYSISFIPNQYDSDLSHNSFDCSLLTVLVDCSLDLP